MWDLNFDSDLHISAWFMRFLMKRNETPFKIKFVNPFGIGRDPGFGKIEGFLKLYILRGWPEKTELRQGLFIYLKDSKQELISR